MTYLEVLQRCAIVFLFVIFPSTIVGAQSHDDGSSFKNCALMTKLPDGKFTYSMAEASIITSFASKTLGASLEVENAENVVSVVCAADSILPTDFDLKVLMTGRTMMRSQVNRKDGRLISVLEVVDGQIQVRTISGIFTNDELMDVQKSINTLQIKYQDYNEN